MARAQEADVIKEIGIGKKKKNIIQAASKHDTSVKSLPLFCPVTVPVSATGSKDLIVSQCAGIRIVVMTVPETSFSPLL